MSIFDEELLEPIARYFRLKQGVKHLSKSNNLILCDLGCGPKIRFYNHLIKQGFDIKRYYGIDPLIDSRIKSQYVDNKVIRLVKAPLKKRIPLNNNSVDLVVGFAFLEHIDYPSHMISESVRVLARGGRAIFTTPSHKAQKLLEFLSFKLKLISEREIREHKNYFSKEEILSLLPQKEHKLNVKHKYFEMGMNNLLVITKE